MFQSEKHWPWSNNGISSSTSIHEVCQYCSQSIPCNAEIIENIKYNTCTHLFSHSYKTFPYLLHKTDPPGSPHLPHTSPRRVLVTTSWIKRPTYLEAFLLLAPMKHQKPTVKRLMQVIRHKRSFRSTNGQCVSWDLLFSSSPAWCQLFGYQYPPYSLAPT